MHVRIKAPAVSPCINSHALVSEGKELVNTRPDCTRDIVNLLRRRVLAIPFEKIINISRNTYSDVQILSRIGFVKKTFRTS